MDVYVCVCVCDAIHFVLYLLFVCHLILHSIAKRYPSIRLDSIWFGWVRLQYFESNARLNCWSTTQFSIAISRIHFELTRFSVFVLRFFFMNAGYIYSIFFRLFSIVIVSFFVGNIASRFHLFDFDTFYCIYRNAAHHITLQNCSLFCWFL